MFQINSKLESSETDLFAENKRKANESSDDNEEELESKVFGKKKKNLLKKSSEYEESDDEDFDLRDEIEEKSEKERDLEELVFGSIESSFVNNIDKISKRNKKIKDSDNKISIGDHLEPKPAWNDDADDEMYFFFLFKFF